MTVPANIPAPMMATGSGPAPIVEATNTSSQDSDTTSHTISLPAGIVAGNLLLVLIAVDSNEPITWPGDWTELISNPSGGPTIAVAYKEAAGSDTCVFTTPGSENSAHNAYRISGAKDPAIQAPEASTLSTNSDTNPDPGVVSPTGGAKNYLFIAGTVSAIGDMVTAPPSGYSNMLAKNSTGTTTDDVAAGSAEMAALAASENPATFTKSTAEKWRAVTIAVHPV